MTWAEQEAPVRLWTPDGAELWAGKLSLDPETQRGTRSIKAEGYAQDIQAATTRMFYRIDGTGQFVADEDDPHGYVTAGQDLYDLHIGTGSIKWRFGDGNTAYASADRNGALIWVEGGVITQYKITVWRPVSLANFQVRSSVGDGPSGTLTLVDDHLLNAADGSAYTRAVSGGDLLRFQIQCNGATTPAVRRAARVASMKVYGRTTDDAYSASEVVTDVGADAGFDTTGVQSNSLAVLPLDWTEEHPGLLDYIADLTDWQWQALGPTNGVPRLAFGPFETTWTAYQSHGVRPNWEPQKRYNGVKVPYESVSGRSLAVTVTADPDPFPGQTITYEAEPLENPQPDSTLATAVATAQAPYWSSPRAAGRIEIGRVTDDHGAPADGYKVRPGHLINVAERADLGPQRVVAVTYRERSVTADVGRDFSVIRLLSDLQRQGRKRRRKGRR